jgi:molybdenum cofactor guanylyltransferase
MKVTTIILCGGQGRRFGGKSKGTAVVDGKRIIDRIIERVYPISNQIMIVTSAENSNISVDKEIKIAIDKYPATGPLGGIYTGLTASDNPISIVVGCDMPFINNRLLKHMVDISDNYDAVIPRLGKEMVEALHSVYRKTCIPVMQADLEKGKFSIYKVIDRLNVRYIQRDEYQSIDPRMLSFLNINYPEDLERANRLAMTEDTTGFLREDGNGLPPPAPSML